MAITSKYIDLAYVHKIREVYALQDFAGGTVAQAHPCKNAQDTIYV